MHLRWLIGLWSLHRQLMGVKQSAAKRFHCQLPTADSNVTNVSP